MPRMEEKKEMRKWRRIKKKNRKKDGEKDEGEGGGGVQGDRKTSTAGVKSMCSRPGLLQTQFAYCRRRFPIFSGFTRSMLPTMHPSNLF